jgi:filamentous hemagglutinin
VSGQTSVIGSNSVDIRTEKNTAVEGAVIAAENGNLKLDTGTLTYKDLQDKDTGSNTQAGVMVPLGDKPLETATRDASYDAHDKRQANRATIGEGTIIIRSDPAQGLACPSGYPRGSASGSSPSVSTGRMM